MIFWFQVWAGPLSGKRLVAALWNRCSDTVTITAKWEALGLDSRSSVSVRDLWKVRRLDQHECTFIKIQT